MRLDRRQLLAATATVCAGAAAGCSASEEPPTYDGPRVDAPSGVESYLSDTSNFDGEMLDWTGREDPTVDVGIQGNGGNYAFGPAAMQVAAGTTVTWEWTGEGQAHNVVHEDGTFESQSTAEEGFTFSHTFESTGTYRYVCTPHRSQGMKAVVVVTDARTSSATAEG
ncbi:halocyanin domain-containing protein [Halapricum sp. CBA1109]|uniref:halocyanin domain-containing protein n=1 Tax=Halapricum sp. CBA1109 TaxID=2668068 RepID=UPI0012FB2247|nr:halocyanin domain-containing protein [Halapricum sp. CBA1109]MUV90814.1 halocyanin domain-containing protein [Halapricum sp. CBA1109]